MSDLGAKLIQAREGRRATVYQDTLGRWTIGIGACVDSRVSGAGLCGAAIDAQFAHDTAQAFADAAAVPGYYTLNDVRKAVIESMCFQLGSLDDWPEFRAAIARADYWAAADNMLYATVQTHLPSHWYIEDPKRCQLEADMMRSGTWIDST
jgi:lysozyme